MKFLTLLSFQAFVIAFLCSSAIAAKRAATLDEVIKALGSLYQQKLFTFRDEADDFENAGGHIIGGKPVKPVPDVRETVTIPRYHYCMKSIPYCVTFYGSVFVQEDSLRQSGSQRKNIRKAQHQLCVRNIELGTCTDIITEDAVTEVVDVQNLDIPDFCFPGNIELRGNVEFFRKITENATVRVHMDPIFTPDRGNRFNEPAAYPQDEYVYNLCELLERNISCPLPCESHLEPPLPCSCEIESGVYDTHNFVKRVEDVDFFGLGRRSGFAVVSTEDGSSCFSFNFTGYDGMS